MSGLLPMRNWPNRAKSLVVLGVVGVAATIVALRGCAKASDINQTRSAVFEIQSAAIRWQIEHGDSACPTTRQLIGGRTLISSTRLVDAWDQPFVITCFQLTIGVTSFGPDRKRGTQDDIVALPAPVRQ